MIHSAFLFRGNKSGERGLIAFAEASFCTRELLPGLARGGSLRHVRTRARTVRVVGHSRLSGEGSKKGRRVNIYCASLRAAVDLASCARVNVYKMER